MIDQTKASSQLALDTRAMGELQRAARQNSPEALKSAAQQFEALFLNMMLKSMRDATPQGGAFGSEQGQMYTAMLDQQLSQTMASRGIGLAEVLVRQLSVSRPDGQMASALPEQHMPQELRQRAVPAPAGSSHLPDSSIQLSASGKSSARSVQPAHVQAFRERMTVHAEAASRDTGIPAKFILGQAALESGWGRHEIIGHDGMRSHNLFAIKAGSGWKGRMVETVTTEYVNGVPLRKVEKFRAYDSYADAFRDYANLLGKNPRYQSAIAHAQDAVGFARELQRAGYATDPQYAAKLARVIQRNFA